MVSVGASTMSRIVAANLATRRRIRLALDVYPVAQFLLAGGKRRAATRRFGVGGLGPSTAKQSLDQSDGVVAMPQAMS